MGGKGQKWTSERGGGIEGQPKWFWGHQGPRISGRPDADLDISIITTIVGPGGAAMADSGTKWPPEVKTVVSLEHTVYLEPS